VRKDKLAFYIKVYNISKYLFISVLLFCLAFLFCFQANGQTTYTGIASGNWNEVGTWDANGIPPTTLPSTDLIIISCGACTIINNTGGAIVIDGSLTIGANAILDMEAQDLTIGLNANTATLTIDQDGILVDVNNLKAKRDITPDGDLGNGPFINNSGTITTETISNIGQNMGGGKLTNTNTGIITISGGNIHVDGTIDNAGIISITGNVDLHGAVVTGGGTFNITGEIKMHAGAGAGGATQGGPASVISQAFGDGAGCSGANSPAPFYKVTGGTITIGPLGGPSGDDTYTYQELLDEFGTSNGTDFTVDANNVSSCGETPLCDIATAVVEPDATVCYNAAYTLEATAINGTILWSTSGDGGFGATATTEDAVYTPGSTDNGADVTLTMTVTGVCNTASDDIILTVVEEIASDAGADTTICNIDYILDATFSSGTGVWTSFSGPGDVSFADTTNPNSLVSVSVNGTYEFIWNETNGFCEDQDTVLVSFQGPIANAGLGGNSCDTTFSLQSALSSGSDGIWSITGGPGTGVFSPDNINTNATIIVSEYGSYKLVWTENYGICYDHDTITVNFYEPPIANAGVETTVCNLDYLLDAKLTTGAGMWASLSGPADVSFADSANPNSLVSVTLNGSYEFLWTETNVICEDQDTILVSFQGPIANAGVGGNSCDSTFNLESILSSGTDGIWSITEGLGTAVFFPDNTSTNSVISVSDYGTYKIQWIENNGICVDHDTIIVNFYETPDANAGENNTVCNLDYLLDANLSTGVGVWKKLSGPGDASFVDSTNSNTLVSVSLDGSYEFLWTETNVVCEDQDTIIVLFEQSTIANAGRDTTVCNLDYQLDATLSTGTGVWETLSGPGDVSFTDKTNPNSAVSVSANGSYKFIWIVTNINCENQDTINVLFKKINSLNAGDDDDVCGLEYELSASASLENCLWYLQSGPDIADFDGYENNNIVFVKVGSPGMYTFKWATEEAYCADSSFVTIAFYEKPEIYAGNDQFLNNRTETEMRATLNDGYTGNWQVISGFAIIEDISSPNTKVTNIQSGENILRWIIDGGHCRDSADVSLNVSEFISPTVITPNGDNKNDYFIINKANDGQIIKLIVYNGWGKEVYYSYDYKNDWDGRDMKGNELPDGTYYYKIDFGDKNIVKNYVLIKR